jgi:hypothetical protein
MLSVAVTLFLTSQASYGQNQEDLQRNLNACQFGLMTCDQSLLTEPQKQTVYSAYLQRNLNACQFGLMTAVT